MSDELWISSDGNRLHADVYGSLPARHVAVLVHGMNWDADRWRPYAPRLVDAGLAAIALDLRGHGLSEGASDTEFVEGRPWSPATDLRATKALVRKRCGGDVRISLVGCSLGGHAVLASSFERDVSDVVSISAPVVAISDHLSRRVSGRKLYVCASDDRAGATRHALTSFAALTRPKELRIFDGTEHSIAMFDAPYGEQVIQALLEFLRAPVPSGNEMPLAGML